MSSALYFGDDSDSDTYDPNDTTLPFPKPLDRAAFLQPDFSAAAFLANLHNRFQTLEDLQAELQDLLKGLNKELVDLVNDNYTDFLSLGDRLRGGEERIEEIRVGLLGFQRDVSGVRNLVGQRSEDVKALLDEKRQLRKDIRLGRTLLEIDDRIKELETRLGIAPPQKPSEPVPNRDSESAGDSVEAVDTLVDGFHDWDESWTRDDAPEFDSEPSDDEGESLATPTDHDLPRRLRRSLEKLQAIQLLGQKCGQAHPFVLAQRDRISGIKGVLRKDLEAEIRNQPAVQVKQRLIKLRSELDD